MTKWLWLLCLPLLAFSPLVTTHDTPQKVDDEFRNYELGLQPRRWKVYRNTPTLNDMQEDECVKVSSNSWVAIMCRDRDDIYSIKLSCVTVVK